MQCTECLLTDDRYIASILAIGRCCLAFGRDASFLSAHGSYHSTRSVNFVANVASVLGPLAAF